MFFAGVIVVWASAAVSTSSVILVPSATRLEQG
jgi:hypothetical protein